MPPAVIDSSIGNSGAFTDVTDDLPQPDIAQNPQAVAPVEPHPILNPPEPAELEAINNTSYFVEPNVESIKDFEPVDHADNIAGFSEAAYENSNNISTDPFADPPETHSHSPVVMPLPSFDDVIASIPIRRAHSMSFLKNGLGDTGNLIKTESVFFFNILL